MKKKIIAFAMVISMAAIAVVGGTMAYFTDTDAKNNVFTTGNVDIELVENFEQNSKLLPSTGSAQNGTLQNGITKEIRVKNTGSEDAYVRVHIAIPSILDDGDPSFDAGKNVLHFNYSSDSIGEGKWDWSKAVDDNKYEGNWNFYTTTINDVSYNVYVVTYGTALKKDEVTSEKAMNQVYLDSKVTNADIERITKALGNEGLQIKVVAEGTQAVGFDNAYEALNESFGVPGNYNVNWASVKSN